VETLKKGGGSKKKKKKKKLSSGESARGKKGYPGGLLPAASEQGASRITQKKKSSGRAPDALPAGQKKTENMCEEPGARDRPGE